MGRTMPSGLWARLDAGIYALERVIVVGATALMVIAVAISVSWSIFTEVAAHLDGQGVGATAALGLAVWLALCLFAVRTARPAWGWSRVGPVGALLGAGILALGFALIWLLPNGLIFSQKLALGLMMWVVFLGSSIAARQRRHIAVQAAQRLIPAKYERPHAALSLLFAAAFTLFLVWVGARYCWTNFTDWRDSGHLVGLFEPTLGIPNWAVSLSVPLGLGITAARFMGQAVAVYSGHMPARAQTEEEELASAEQSPDSLSVGASQ